MMRLIKYDTALRPATRCAATIGFFDGVHRGHRFLIDRVKSVAGAEGLPSAVVTFTGHPRAVTDPGHIPMLLTTPDEKVKQLATTGIDICYTLDFDRRLADMTAEQFMREVLRDRLGVAVLVVGYDHRFGHGRRESYEDYQAYGRQLGIKVLRAEGLAGGRHEVSASSIRRALADGNVRLASAGLGRDYDITGTVVDGYHIGRTMGFPTANIAVPAGKMLPAGGVYAVTTDVGGKAYDAMLNIGSRPTFGQQAPATVEMNIFGFDGNIYGQRLTVHFVERMRAERKFDSPGALAEQLQKDKRDIATLLYVERNADADPREVALHAGKDKDIDYARAATQIEGRRMARHKLPLHASTRGIIYPRHLSMEQCSSQRAADFKATLAGGGTMIDLTGGFGVDCLAMARRFDRATYVERDEELCRIMRHNAPLLGGDNIEVINADAAGYLSSCGGADLIYIDPARRDTHGSRVIGLSQCTPDLTEMGGLLLSKGHTVMAKLSPMLDIKAMMSDLTGISTVYAVAIDGECKELLAVMHRDARGEPCMTAVNLKRDGTETFTFTMSEEAAATPAYAPSVGTFLYLPNAAVMKTGAFKCVATRFGLAKLAPGTHLYTSDAPVQGFPGRRFAVTAVYGAGRQELKQLTRQCTRANVVTRNFPLTPDRLREKLRMADGGDDYVIGATLADGKKVVVLCRKE